MFLLLSVIIGYSGAEKAILCYRELNVRAQHFSDHFPQTAFIKQMYVLTFILFNFFFFLKSYSAIINT